MAVRNTGDRNRHRSHWRAYTGDGRRLDSGRECDPDELFRLLRHIKEHPEELAEKQKVVRDMHVRTIPEMCEDYREFYRDLISGHPVTHIEEGIDFEFIFQGLAMGEPNVSGRGAVASLNRLKQENKRLKFAMEALKGTTSYKVARKISKANIPFKETLKKMVKK